MSSISWKQIKMRAMEIKKPPAESSRPFIQTSLYDLMEALHEETDFEEDGLITVAVLDLMESGKILWMENQKNPCE